MFFSLFSLPQFFFPRQPTVLRVRHEEEGTREHTGHVVFCIAPQRGRLMAAVMQRDCPFHGALRGKTHVVTRLTQMTHVRARVKLRRAAAAATEIEV